LSEEKELTSDEIKKIIYKQIDKKRKEIETEKTQYENGRRQPNRIGNNAVCI